MKKCIEIRETYSDNAENAVYAALEGAGTVEKVLHTRDKVSGFYRTIIRCEDVNIAVYGGLTSGYNGKGPNALIRVLIKLGFKESLAEKEVYCAIPEQRDFALTLDQSSHIKFVDGTHRGFYATHAGRFPSNPYLKALIYVLGIYPDTRANISRLYNFEEKTIIPAGLNEGWQTGSTMIATQLAFNLFNGFCYEVPDDEDDEYVVSKGYTPYDLFYIDVREYFFEGIRIRFEVK